MEMASIGFLLGAICCLFGALVGRLSGDRDDQKQYDRNSCVDSNIPCRNRSGSCAERDSEQIDDEEIIMVLEYFRLSASRYEKKILDILIDRIRKGREQ